MRNGPFLLFSLGLLSAWTCFHLWLRGEIRGDDRAARASVQRALREVSEWKLATAVARRELADWRQHVAALIPGSGSDASYPLRAIASVVSEGEGEEIALERAETLMERGKDRFRAKDFAGANEAFRKLLDSYPTSRHVVEARLLLVEGLAALARYGQAVDEIELMIENYPEADATGYALHRLGVIYEALDRPEDAAQMYRAVAKHYARLPELASQAAASLKAVER